MIEPEFLDRIGTLLEPIGATPDEGESFRDPILDVLRYDRRPIRLHWFPVLGRALSVVAVVRNPLDITFTLAGYRELLNRTARAVHSRFPPWPRGGPGFAITLTTVVLTPEPITPEDEAKLQQAFPEHRRSRVVPIAIIRANLGQEAMAIAFNAIDQEMIPEPFTLVDGFSDVLRQFVPPTDL